MTQESTTVYAKGGQGYNNLIAWEGEKQMTFKVTDALISPMGLAVLSGAGLFEAGKDGKLIHSHVTMTKKASAQGVISISYDEVAQELGINNQSDIFICTGSNNTGDAYGTIVDSTGYGYAWLQNAFTVAGGSTATTGDPTGTVKLAYADKDSNKPVTFTAASAEVNTAKDKTIKVDFYVLMKSGASQIVIEPSSFGGYFYVEADTLFRREDDGQDMAATLTFPRVKVQSGFTFTMAASGDPSTFDFTMDAFPGTTQFDTTKKVCVVIDMIGSDADAATAAAAHTEHTAKTGV